MFNSDAPPDGYVAHTYYVAVQIPSGVITVEQNNSLQARRY